MARVQRMGDTNSAGGAITTIAQSTVFANNKLVSIDGSSGTADAGCNIFAPQHCAGVWKTAGGSPNVFIGGVPVNTEGNVDTCGHARVGGSSNVFIN